ncbi:uncharacterized protein LOC131648597 [Vicia villosa]|uniref:uncharacterized protein LOC131648597 n=1 Tax=Vicia villosa TaxID=3911 RepID=UPI00273C9B84|nr:uncharacterized protein LOC131648597 [Vicia villosa]
MDCTPYQNVCYGTHMLAVEADDWWLETRQRLKTTGEVVTWAVFRREFLGKYFPEDVRGTVESMRRTTMLIIKLLVRSEVITTRTVASLMMLQLARVNRKLHKVRGLVGEMLCFKCGKPGHKSNMCNAEAQRCFRCGKTGHMALDCKHKEVICFICGEEGHISAQCQKPKKAPGSGKVFALVGTHTASED